MGQTQVVQVPFAPGIDQKTTSEWLDPSSKQSAIVNGNFTKSGAIDKRLGMAHLSTSVIPGGVAPGGNITSAARLTSWTKSGLTLAVAGALYNYSDAESMFAGVGFLSPVTVQRRPTAVPSGTIAPILCDFAQGGRTLRIAMYLNAATHVTCMVYDAVSGDLVQPPTEIYSSSNTGVPIACVYLPNAPTGKQIAAVFKDVTSHVVYGCSYNPATNAWTSPASIVTINGAVDVVPYYGEPGGGLIVTYSDSLTAKFAYVNPSSFATSHLTTVETYPGGSTVVGGIYAHAQYGVSDGTIWIAYSYVSGGTNTLSRAACYNGDGTYALLTSPFSYYNQVGASQHGGGIVRVTATTAFTSFWTVQTTALLPNLSAPQGQWATLTTSGATSGGTMPLGMLPVTKPVVQNGTVYQAALLAFRALYSIQPSAVHSQQGTLYLLKPQTLTSGASMLPVATVAPRQMDINITILQQIVSGFQVPLMSGQPGAAVQALCLKTIGSDQAGLGGAVGPTWQVDFTWDASLLYASGELASTLHLSGGTPFVCDGASTFEDSFFYYPEFANVAQSGAGGLLSGNYTWAVVYTYADSSGLIHRGSPVFTPTLNVTLGMNPTVSFLPCLTWRDVSNPTLVFAEIYRTTTGNPTTFFLVDYVPCSNTSAVAVSYTDTASDAKIQVATILYTTGGILDHVNPPSAWCQAIHKGRKWIVDDTRRTLWFTKAFNGTDAPGFHEQLTLPVNEGGDITGLANLDDKLIVFKATSIWAIYGDGPAETGQGSDLTLPQRVASDVGALDWRSVVLTPMGLMFQAAAGIYLLGRDMQVTFIGKQVVDSLKSYPTVTSAVLVPTTNQARFTCSNGATCLTVCYDYLLSAWTTHSYAQMPAPVVAGALSNAQGPTPQYVVASSDGNVWREHLATDNFAWGDMDVGGTNHFFPTTITTQWFKLQGVEGYQRARKVTLFAERLDAAGVTMGFAVNFQSPVVQSTAWTEAPFTGSTLICEQHVGALYNKQQSLQITVNDTAPVHAFAVTDQGVRFVALSVELDALGPRYRQVPVGARG